MMYFRKDHQSLQTQIDVLQQFPHGRPVFRTPEALYTAVNTLVSKNDRMSAAEKDQATADNIKRMENMRA